MHLAMNIFERGFAPDRRAILRGAALGCAWATLPLRAQAPARSRGVPIEMFGGDARPGIDNGNALRRAFADAARDGASVILGPGRYEFSSVDLLRRGAIGRPAGVALIGSGADRTEVRITGRSVINHLFRADNVSGVLTSGIRFVGNGVKDETAPYAGALMAATLTADAPGDMSDVLLEGCEIDNFASATWLLFSNRSGRRVIRRVGSRDCRWISRPQTAPQAGSITVPGHFVYFDGGGGAIEDIIVDDELMDAANVKGGVAAIGDVNRGTIHVGVLRDAGRALSSVPAGPDGPGAYAILLYQKPKGVPRNLAISVDRLENADSVGVYAVGAQGCRIHIGYASGQRDTRDATLFKGVLAILGGSAIDATIDTVEDCNRVAMISVDGGQNLGRRAEAMNISIHLGSVRSRRGARDITIDAGGSPRAGGVRISGTRDGPAAVGVHLRTGPGVVLQDIDLSGLRNGGSDHPLWIGPGNVDMRRISLPN